MASCFVGIRLRGEDVVDFPTVLLSVRKKLPVTIAMTFPYTLLEVWFSASRYPLYSLAYILLATFFTIRKLKQSLREDYFLGKFNSHLSYFLIIICCLLIIDLYLGIAWLMLPYLWCGMEIPNQKYTITNCYDHHCNFITVNLTPCLEDTWFSSITDNLIEFPVFSPNSSKQDSVYLASHAYLINMAFIHGWTLARQICIDGLSPINSLEALMSICVLLTGFFFFKWLMPGKVCSHVMQQEMRNMTLDDDLSIVSTYCQVEQFHPNKQEQLKAHYQARFWHKAAFLATPEFRELPLRHQKNIINHSYAPYIKATRIFREIDATVISCLCHKLKIKLYLKGETVILPASVPPGLSIILNGTMMAVAIHPINQAAMVRLKRGDVFGELSVCFRLATPILIVAETNCKVLMLHRDDWAALAAFIPQKTRKAVILNHRGILDSTVCIFHEGNEISIPPGLKKAIQTYWRSPNHVFPVEMCRVHVKDKDTCKIPMKFVQVWMWMVGIISLSCFYVIMLEVYSESMLELFWPQNILSISGDNEEDSVSCDERFRRCHCC